MKAKVTISVEIPDRIDAEENNDVLRFLKTVGYDTLKMYFKEGIIDSANWVFEEEVAEISEK